MNLVAGLYFAAYLILVGGTFRFIEYNYPDSMIGKGLVIVY